MPSIGTGCHELRITDIDKIWRILYRIDPNAIIIVAVFKKKTRKTPMPEIKNYHIRLAEYDS